MRKTSSMLRELVRLRMCSTPLENFINLCQLAADELDAKDARIAELEYQLRHAQQYVP